MDANITNKTISMRNGTTKMKRDGEYWTEEERKLLRERFAAGVPVNEIAIELDRSESGVYQQIQQMKLYAGTSRKRNSGAKKPVCLCSVCCCDPALCPLKNCCQQMQEEK